MDSQMKKLALAAVLAAIPAFAFAQAVGVSVATETLVRVGKEVRANFSVQNATDRNLKMVFVSCTFFDGEKKPFNTQTAIVNNVVPGQKAFGKATVIDAKVIQGADCRFSSAE